MEELFSFNVLIPSYKEVSNGNRNVIYYIVEIYKMNIKKWTLEKRYSEFANLHARLDEIYGNLPTLPPKSLLPLKDPSEIEQRRKGLEIYLQLLMGRRDIISSDYMRRFLQAENFAPEILLKPPTLISEIVGFNFGIRDFYYEIEKGNSACLKCVNLKGLLFTAISDMSVFSRIDAYLTNIKLPWDKKDENRRLVPIAAVECYKRKGQDLFNFERIWFKEFTSQVIVIYWDDMSSLLAIGSDDGTVTVLKALEGHDYQSFEEVRGLKYHSKRVMGLYIDSISEYIYSVGGDGQFKTLNPRNGTTIADISCGDDPLTALVVDKDNKRAFISNSSGSVFIFDIASQVPQLIHSIQIHPTGRIRGLWFDKYKNYLFTANYDDGVLALTDLQKPGKEKYAHVIANYHGKLKVRCCVWSTYRTELFTGTEEGVITFWDAKKASPLYAVKAHSAGITKLQWIEGQRTLIVAGKDKKLSFYKLPLEWRDKKVEAELYKETLIRKKTEAMIQLKRSLTKIQADSDEDDLAGWASEP